MGERIQEPTTPIAVPAGTLILRDGQPDGYAFVVISGGVEVFIRGEVVSRIGAGEVVTPLHGHGPTADPVTARAVVATTYLQLPRCELSKRDA